MTLPAEIIFDSWKTAWSGRGGIDAGNVFLRPFFWNSIKMVVPAVAISTFFGALNGYALTKWRFRGDNLVFLLFLFGCFIPYQAILLPMARTLGVLGISNSITGLVVVHIRVYGLSFTTLFFRNYYVSIPDEMIKAARIDGAGFFKIFFKVLLAYFCTYHSRYSNLAIYKYLERFSLWFFFFIRGSSPDPSRTQQYGANKHQRQRI